MLIVCSGPDTYHARKKAQELVSAFKQKHDPTGYSTEVMQKPDVAELLGKLGAPSLFAQKRLIKCDGLLGDIKIADVRSLAKRIESDNGQTIILTVEEEPLAAKHEKEFEKIKLVVYPYPLLSGTKFENAVKQRAQELGVPMEIASTISRNTEGDMWLAESELQKCTANPNAPLVQRDRGDGNIFEAAESFISQRVGWRIRIEGLDEPGSMPSVFLSQARTYAAVKDGETNGIHPYAARKFSSLRLPASRAAHALLGALRTFTASRSGISSTGEEDALL